jgi:hypothetical protein
MHPGRGAHPYRQVREAETYRHPQIREGRLLWLACTICGPGSYGGTLPHFDDEEQLWDVMLGEYEWTRRDDGRVLCRHHSSVADCDAFGHAVSAWTQHPIEPDIDWRYCTRCGAHFEQRIAGSTNAR